MVSTELFGLAFAAFWKKVGILRLDIAACAFATLAEVAAAMRIGLVPVESVTPPKPAK